MPRAHKVPNVFGQGLWRRAGHAPLCSTLNLSTDMSNAWREPSSRCSCSQRQSDMHSLSRHSGIALCGDPTLIQVVALNSPPEKKKNKNYAERMEVGVTVRHVSATHVKRDAGRVDILARRGSTRRGAQRHEVAHWCAVQHGEQRGTRSQSRSRSRRVFARRRTHGCATRADDVIHPPVEFGHARHYGDGRRTTATTG